MTVMGVGREVGGASNLLSATVYQIIYSHIYTSITDDSNDSIPQSIDHQTVQYVDDSSNIVSSNNTTQLQLYINKFFKVLEGFYNMNKLLLNADKTKLLITCKPKYRNSTAHITLQANQYTIQRSSKIKVLAIYIISGLTNTATINNVISKVNYRLSVLIWSISRKGSWSFLSIYLPGGMTLQLDPGFTYL